MNNIKGSTRVKSYRINNSVFEELKTIATQNNSNVNRVINELTREYIKKSTNNLHTN